MTEQAGISKMETVDVEKERERFKVFLAKDRSQWVALYSRLGIDDPEEAEALAFYFWLAAKKQAAEEMEVAEYQIQYYYSDFGAFGRWHPTTKEMVDKHSSNPHIRTRALYAKKGECCHD